MKALIIGATGATGRDLVKQLLADNSFSEVHIFVRKPTEIQHPKLHSHIVDFAQPDTWKHLLSGDVAFSCMGTTLKQAGSKEAQWKIDFDYQLDFAKNTKNAGVQTFVLVSSSWADAKARSFYIQMKGKLEDEVKALDFPKLAIFQPSILERKNSDRFWENLSLKIIKILNSIGILTKMKPMPTEILAQAMIKQAKIQKEKVQTISLNNIFKI